MMVKEPEPYKPHSHYKRDLTFMSLGENTTG